MYGVQKQKLYGNQEQKNQTGKAGIEKILQVLPYTHTA